MTDQPINFTSNPAACRQAVRREKLAARAAMPTQAHRAASEKVREYLHDCLAARPVGVVGFCMAIRGEVDCRPLVESLLQIGWRAVMPVVVKAHAPMEFRGWTPSVPMTADRHGIAIPIGPPTMAPDLLLLPLVAFDAAGYRLGYGGGYFDRTLAACWPRPLAIGVGFDLAAVESIHPAPHDQRLDLIVTESGIRWIKSP